MVVWCSHSQCACSAERAQTRNDGLLCLVQGMAECTRQASLHGSRRYREYYLCTKINPIINSINNRAKIIYPRLYGQCQLYNYIVQSHAASLLHWVCWQRLKRVILSSCLKLQLLRAGSRDYLVVTDRRACNREGSTAEGTVYCGVQWENTQSKIRWLAVINKPLFNIRRIIRMGIVLVVVVILIISRFPHPKNWATFIFAISLFCVDRF